ncbi:MAG: polysaccharide deacetylase family protein [Bacillota bacterium]
MRGRVWAWGSAGNRPDFILATENYLVWLVLILITLSGSSGIPWMLNIPRQLYGNMAKNEHPSQGNTNAALIKNTANLIVHGPVPKPAAVNVVPSIPTDLGAAGRGDQLAAADIPMTPIHSVPQAGKKIALTFDDGPNRHWTEAYLEVLEKEQVPATFFLIGKRAAEYPQLVLSIMNKGHDVGSHSFSHRKMGNLKHEEVQQEIAMAARTISGITSRPVHLFRPPYGSYNEDVLESAREQSSYTVTWSVDPRDWDDPGADMIVRRVVAGTRGGSIILLHEGKPQTLAALPMIIKELRGKGYKFVKMTELLQSAEK